MILIIFRDNFNVKKDITFLALGVKKVISFFTFKNKTINLV